MPKVKFKDFHDSLVVFAVTCFIFGVYLLLGHLFPDFYASQPWSPYDAQGTWGWNNGQYGLLFVGAFLMNSIKYFICDFREPRNKAIRQQKQQAKDWEQDILLPYLSQKYGIKLKRSTDFFAEHNNMIFHNGESMKVTLHGLRRVFDNTLTEKTKDEVFYYVQTADEITLTAEVLSLKTNLPS